MSAKPGFHNLYQHGFVRVAVAVPAVRVADPGFNARETVRMLGEARARGAVVAVFPELGLTGYTCEDLFHQQALQVAALDALAEVRDATRGGDIVAVVGLPLLVDGALYNVAAVLCGGRIRGVVPKTYLPNYREFYELRQFAPGDRLRRESVVLCGEEAVPIGSRLVFATRTQPSLALHVEICEDLWAPIPPSSSAALAGATVLLNLSASNVTVGKDAYRRELASNQSARCIAAYLYAAAGFGESTTDLAWDGHAFVYENGTLLAESQRFSYHPQLVTADVDLDRLVQDRMRQNTFGQAAERHAVPGAFRQVELSLVLPDAPVMPLERSYDRFPYVPTDPARRDARCQEIYEIQVQGLARRLRSIDASKVVIGVSGGLDSTHALLVCARTFDVLGLPRSGILAYTMPGFATSSRTLGQAHRLMQAVGATATQIDIRPSCSQMLADIGHPYSRGEQCFDVTFENVQAGERTSHLFRLANLHGAIVVGTSDLSELALGWSTYGVGDHMAHYHVNASVPKTLVQYLVRWVADRGSLGAGADEILHEILATEISPELVPGGTKGEPAQLSEDVVGPYELQDFILYYVLRFGYAPPKVAFLAAHAWSGGAHANWPGARGSEPNHYGPAEIKRWMRVFVRRFFGASQYKRSCIANAPKVGSGGSLSPRGDWRAPSDGVADAWLALVERLPESAPQA